MKKEIIIIGGGFAGINLIQRLTNRPEFNITLVDKNNYNFFPPLIYQVATGFLEVTNITYPFRKLFQKKRNVKFRMGSLLKVVPEENKIILNNGELHYDYLVIATGTETNYFGIENIMKHALPMKTINDALFLRNSLLERFEEATRITDPFERKKYTSIVIAGGGPTGVELAGMLAEMRKNIFRKDYPELSGSGGEIYLIDGAPTLLTPMSSKSQQYTFDSLVKMGVKVILNVQVKDFVNDTVMLSSGDSISAKTLIWSAGVTASVFEGFAKEQYGRGRRLLVNEYNQVQGTENIFAIGDTALMLSDPGFPDGHPQVAQVAIQQGNLLGKNLIAKESGNLLKPFRYSDKGTMAIIGRSKAAAELPKPKIRFTGFFAWFAWLFVHLMSLISYRNRLTTLYNWGVAFFTKDQALRMIIRPLKKSDTE
jgi:NADH dehydrogenase